MRVVTAAVALFIRDLHTIIYSKAFVLVTCTSSNGQAMMTQFYR